MLSCWKETASERPTFANISSDLMQLLESASAENYMDAVRNDDEIEVEIID